MFLIYQYVQIISVEAGVRIQPVQMMHPDLLPLLVFMQVYVASLRAIKVKFMHINAKDSTTKFLWEAGRLLVL